MIILFCYNANYILLSCCFHGYCRDNPDQMAKMVLMDCQESLDHKARRDSQELGERLDHWDHLVHLVSLDRKADVERKGQLVPEEREVHLVPQDRRLDSSEPVFIFNFIIRETKERLVHLEHLVLMEEL